MTWSRLAVQVVAAIPLTLREGLAWNESAAADAGPLATC